MLYFKYPADEVPNSKPVSIPEQTRFMDLKAYSVSALFEIIPMVRGDERVEKIFSMALVALLGMALAACGGNSGNGGNTGNTGGGASADTGNTGQAGSSKEASSVTLRLSTPDPDTASITVAARELAKVVEQKSGGTIKIEVFPNGTLYGADPSAAVKQLGAGSLDMLALSTSLYANFVPKFSMVSVPYLFDDSEQLMDYFNGEPGQELLMSLDELGIQGAGIWTRNFRQITNSKRPIERPADLSGLRMRVPNNPLWVEYFKAAGSVPTPMAFGEVYNALQLKTIDGQENPVEVPVNNKFYEVQKYLTMSNHMADGWVVALNKAKFDKLSAEQQRIITEAVKEMQAWSADKDKQDESSYIKQLEDNGMAVNELTPEQRDAFIEISKGLYPKFKELVKDDAFFDTSLQFVGKAE